MANRVDTLPAREISGAAEESKTQKRFLLTKSARTFIQFMISYGFLAIGAVFMLFPVFWMVTAALKPTWQITSRDIWIPSLWHKIEAGDSVRLMNLWFAPTEDGTATQDVILFGSKRQYVTMLPVESLNNIVAIPKDQAGAFEVIPDGEMMLNGLKWNNEDYVLVGVDGDNLLTVPQSSLDMSSAVVVPKTRIREGTRADIPAGDYTFQVRQLEIDGKGQLNLIEAGPNIELSTVLPAEYAQSALLVPSDQLGDKKRLPLAESEADQYTLANGSPDERYILLEESDWRPVIGIDVLNQYAFTIPSTAFEPLGEPLVVNKAVFQVGNYTDSVGKTQEVALMVQQEIQTGATQTMLVLPVEYLDSVQMVMSSSLLEPFPENVDGTAVRTKDFTSPTVEEESIDLTKLPDKVAIVADRQDMSLVIPVSVVTELYDVFNNELQRNLSVNFQFQNFVRAMIRQTGDATFFTFFKNSTIIAGLSIVGHLLSCTMVAYAFARLRAPGKNFLFAIVLGTMMMPEFITVIPVYRIFRDLGMVDTLWPLFLRSFFGNAFFIFLMRQFFSTIPMELEEAARIDGASRLQTFVRILLPLITPALATIVIFTFLGSWNNLFDAAIYLNSPHNYTVAIGLRQFLGQYSAEFNLLMAAATIVMLPTVILFFFAQRYFIEGITLTGMKG